MLIAHPVACRSILQDATSKVIEKGHTNRGTGTVKIIGRWVIKLKDRGERRFLSLGASRVNFELDFEGFLFPLTSDRRNKGLRIP